MSKRIYFNDRIKREITKKFAETTAEELDVSPMRSRLSDGLPVIITSDAPGVKVTVEICLPTRPIRPRQLGGI